MIANRSGRRLGRGLLALALVSTAVCSDTGSLGFDYDFARGPAGWEEGFADRMAATNRVVAFDS